MNNDVSQEKIEPDRKFFQISPESIELIADSAGITNLSRTLSTSLAEDTSYRLRQLIKVKEGLPFIRILCWNFLFMMNLVELQPGLTPQ